MSQDAYKSVLLRFEGRWPYCANSRYQDELDPLVRNVRPEVSTSNSYLTRNHTRPWRWADELVYERLPNLWIVPTELAEKVTDALWRADELARDALRKTGLQPVGLCWRFEPLDPATVGELLVRRTLSKDRGGMGICTTELRRILPDGREFCMSSIIDRETDFAQRTQHSFVSFGSTEPTTFEGGFTLSGDEANKLGSKIAERTWNYRQAMKVLGFPEPRKEVVYKMPPRFEVNK